MDLKKYAGKQVHVQLQHGHHWFVVFAPADSGPPSPMRMKAPDSAADDPGEPVVIPFIVGEVAEDGALIIDTGKGGRVAVEVNPELIHTVCVVVEHAKVSRLVTP
jgi:hypothetical protein